MYKLEFGVQDIENKNNFYRNYKLIPENILDIILKYTSKNNYLSSEEIVKYIGIGASNVRKNLAKMMNRVHAKKYFTRIRKGSFRYYKVSEYDPKNAYKDIINSTEEKVTLNQIGLKDSTCFDSLIENGDTFANVINVLLQLKWFTVCEISVLLGVNHKRGKATIKGELNRCMSCKIKFIEKRKENGINQYRIIYKFLGFTIPEFRELAKNTFPKDKDPKGLGIKPQVLNNIKEMEISNDRI